MRNHIRFLLNDEPVELHDVASGDTLLDFLRLNKRLTGTKEGCAEGDCGACTVLVGRLSKGKLVYETVNACIRFVASLDASHVVTVEHLKKTDGKLHPVQQAMVDHHGSQCGFCTPGIVMSLYALWMANPEPDALAVEKALQGNLCRCTGYQPIINAAMAVSTYGRPEDDPLVVHRKKVTAALEGMQDECRVEIRNGDDLLIVPASLDDLADARRSHPQSVIVSGATDVGLWVNKDLHNISPAIFVGNLEALRAIEITDKGIRIGAGVTYTEFGEIIAEHIPQLKEYWNRIGGEQVRNMGTIGGNIANGSPIGDTPPPLIALGATVTLRSGEERRELPLEDFFLDYGKQDRQPGDFLESVFIPLPKREANFAAYKISKRLDEDISSVAFACRVSITKGRVEEAIVACGGMAAIPRRARSAENALIGNPWNEETVSRAVEALREDYQPIDDWRASAAYRSLVAGNLLMRFFRETGGNREGVRLNREIA